MSATRDQAMQAILDRIERIATGDAEFREDLPHVAGLAQAYASLSGSADPR